MHLTKLIVGGFKSIKEPIEIPLAPITLMFGPNSAGKSTIKDALQELKRRITLPPQKVHFAGLKALFTEDNFAHLCAPADEDDYSFTTNEELESTNVVLGCEYENFNAEENTMVEGPSNEWTYAGLEIYFKLAEKIVRFGFAEYAELLTGAYELSADNTEICSFSGPDQLTNHPDLRELSNSEYKFLARQSLGLITLNLNHPIWSDTDSSELFNQLRKDLSTNSDQWINGAVWFAGNILYIRLRCDARRIQGWTQNIDHYASDARSLTSDFLKINSKIESTCQLINELIHQTENRISRHLELTLVPGSRSLLSTQDVDTGWFKTTSNFGHTDLVTPGSIVDYARWLGKSKAHKKDVESIPLEPGREQSDFVNDVFGTQLFSARRYQIRPEVDIRHETSLLSRYGETCEDETTTTLRVNLYLRDEHGRSLDFNQVGSGISYVLPVLTALWGAKRSWIEQPELHLHPSAQCEMGDAVIRAFNRGCFSVIETHSEHLLLRILRRIRQTSRSNTKIDSELRCQPEAVSVLYFEPLPDGSTSVRQLRVSRSGDFMDRWPGGFFAEREQELFDE